MHVTIHNNINAIFIKQSLILPSKDLALHIVAHVSAVHWNMELNHNPWGAVAVDGSQVIHQPLVL